MTKQLFSFEDNHKAIAAFEELGFTAELDDPANGVYYVEVDLSNHDWLAVLTLLQDCKNQNLEPLFTDGDENLSIDEAIAYVNEKC